MHVPELLRMGADIRSMVSFVRGRKPHPAPVMATDLRYGIVGACGIGNAGISTVSRIYHLERGYSDLETKLRIRQLRRVKG